MRWPVGRRPGMTYPMRAVFPLPCLLRNKKRRLGLTLPVSGPAGWDGWSVLQGAGQLAGCLLLAWLLVRHLPMAR